MPNCLRCGAAFDAVKPNATYCSGRCRTAAFRAAHASGAATPPHNVTPRNITTNNTVISFDGRLPPPFGQGSGSSRSLAAPLPSRGAMVVHQMSGLATAGGHRRAALPSPVMQAVDLIFQFDPGGESLEAAARQREWQAMIGEERARIVRDDAQRRAKENTHKRKEMETVDLLRHGVMAALHAIPTREEEAQAPAGHKPRQKGEPAVDTCWQRRTAALEAQKPQGRRSIAGILSPKPAPAALEPWWRRLLGVSKQSVWR